MEGHQTPRTLEAPFKRAIFVNSAFLVAGLANLTSKGAFVGADLYEFVSLEQLEMEDSSSGFSRLAAISKIIWVGFSLFGEYFPDYYN
jgi:hypothetical protein